MIEYEEQKLLDDLRDNILLLKDITGILNKWHTGFMDRLPAAKSKYKFWGR